MNLDKDMVMLAIVVVGAWVGFKVISSLFKAIVSVAIIGGGVYLYLANGGSF